MRASTFVVTLVSISGILGPAAEASPKRPLVIVISIDGLGAQLLGSLPPKEAPTLTKLAQTGDQAIRAETVPKAQTIPGHASMLSGVDTTKHGRVENEMNPELKKIEVKTIFDLVKNNGLKSAAYFGKEKLRFMFDTGAIDWSVSPRLWPFGDLWGRRPPIVTSTVISLIQKHKPDFLFVHYAIVDTIGHAFRWGSAPQHAVLRSVDESLGQLIDFLELWTAPLSHLRKAATPTFDDYVVIVTADHGGHEGSHGQTTPAGDLADEESDLVIPWIVYRSPRATEKDGRRPSVTKGIVKIFDTSATAASLMGLKVPKDWEWDGVNRVEFTTSEATH